MTFYAEVTGDIKNVKFGGKPMVKQQDGRWVLAA